MNTFIIIVVRCLSRSGKTPVSNPHLAIKHLGNLGLTSVSQVDVPRKVVVRIYIGEDATLNLLEEG